MWTRQQAKHGLVKQALRLWSRLAELLPADVSTIRRVSRVQTKAYDRAVRRIRKAA